MSIVSETTGTIIPTGTWTVDPAHSTVEFLVKHLSIATVRGRALGFSGTIEGGEAPRVEGSVDATSITTFDETRDGHLASPDFFDAERYSELRFASASVELDGDELVVTGEITIKGVTRPIELRGELLGPAVDPWGSERIGLDLAGTIDRTEFGLRWNAPLPSGGFVLPDEVTLSASFSAVKAG